MNRNTKTVMWPQLKILTLGFTPRRVRELCRQAPEVDFVPTMMPGALGIAAAALFLHTDLGRTNIVSLLEQIQDQGNPVPVVVFHHSELQLQALASVMPDLIAADDVPVRDVLGQLLRLLHFEHYSGEMIHALAQSAIDCLKQSFRTDAQIVRSFLGTDRCLADIDVYIPFCGASIAGRLSVSGSISNFTRLRLATVKEPVMDPAFTSADFAGEMTNQILGEFKRVVARDSLSFNLSQPVHNAIASENGRAGTWSRSRLVLELDCGDDEPILTGLSVDRLVRSAICAAPGHPMGAGGAVFAADGSFAAGGSRIATEASDYLLGPDSGESSPSM